MNKYQNNSSELQAKVIVLGDSNVGKTSFINSLNPITNSNDDHKKFATVRIDRHEFDRNYFLDFDVDLKVWENGQGEFSSEQQDAVFTGSLFCIIMFDITNRESSVSAFDKYMKMHNELFPDSFLFVLGTHFDEAIHRQVQIAEASKFCAINDCMYLEISNEDGTNISLVRKLIVHKLNTLIQCHDNLSVRSRQLLNDSRKVLKSGLQTNTNTSKKITELKKPIVVTGSGSGDERQIVPFFDEDILTGSVGEILSSALSTRHWPGLESSANNTGAGGSSNTNTTTSTSNPSGTQNAFDTAAQLKYQESGAIQGIAVQLTSLLDRLGTDNKNIPRVPLDNSIGTTEDVAYTGMKMQQIHYQTQLRNQAALAANTPVASTTAGGAHSSAPAAGVGNMKTGPSAPVDGSLNTNSGYDMSLSELQHAFNIMNLALPMHLYNTDTTQLVQMDEVLRVATNTNDIASIQELVPSAETEVDADANSCHMIEITLKIAPDYATEHVLEINEHFDILRQINSFISQYTTNSVLNSHSKGNVTCNDIDALREGLVDCVFNIIKAKLMNSQSEDGHKSLVVLNNHHSMNHYQTNTGMLNDEAASNTNDIVTVVNIEYSSTQSIANASLANNMILKRPILLDLPNGIRIERIVTIIKPVSMVTMTKTYLTDHTNNNILNVAKEIITENDLSHGYLNTLVDLMYTYIHDHIDKKLSLEEDVDMNVNRNGSNNDRVAAAEALSSI